MAFFNYEAEHGNLPPAVVYGKDGRPLHSWRVLILPYIEQQELYNEFRLSEPWDSEHNLRLHERMPKIYEAPWTKHLKVPPHYTVCHVFLGPGTPFEGRSRKLTQADFPDGLSNTFLIVEAGEPVPWTKPEEILFDPLQPLRLRGLFKDGFRACMADSHVQFVRYEMSEAALRAAITRNGGESPRADW